MSTEAKELIKQLVREQQFSSTGEIMLSIKEIFKEVLEESRATVVVMRYFIKSL